MPFAKPIAAGEAPNGQGKLNLASGTRGITKRPPIMAMDPRRGLFAQRTARRWASSSHSEAQASFCRIKILNEHPCGERKEQRDIHGNLTEKRVDRSVISPGIYHTLSQERRKNARNAAEKEVIGYYCYCV
jgi:hypothetical protein